MHIMNIYYILRVLFGRAVCMLNKLEITVILSFFNYFVAKMYNKCTLL